MGCDLAAPVVVQHGALGGCGSVPGGGTVGGGGYYRTVHGRQNVSPLSDVVFMRVGIKLSPPCRATL